MNLKHDIYGKWAWVHDGKISDRQIEFAIDGDKLKLIVHNKDSKFSLKNLKLNIDTEPDGKKTYFLRNDWAKKDGSGFFAFESSFSESKEGNIFINASEFNFIDEKTLKQNHMGYSFNCKKECWEPFNQEHILKKVES